MYLFSFFIHAADNTEAMWVMYQVISISLFAFLHLLFLFLIKVTELGRLRILFYILTPFPILVIILIIFSPPFIHFVRIDHEWRIFRELPTPVFMLNVILVTLYLMLFFIMLVYSIVNAKYKRERRQYAFLLVTLSLSICGTDLIILLRQYRDFSVIIAPMPLMLISFFVACWYSMKRYHFLALTPQYVANDVLGYIDESVILTDCDGKVMVSNVKTDEIVGFAATGCDIRELIPEYENLDVQLKDVRDKSLKDFSVRVHILSEDGERLLVDSRFSAVRDRFGDILGFLIISKEVKGIKQLNHFYKITVKEAEIIEYMMNGYSNVVIAQNLDITENTLKRHITNIYNKLSVSNRIQLLSMLKDFNIIPEKKSAKTVLLLKTPAV